MSTELIAIKNFEGGLVTYFDPLDIDVNQFQEFQNLMNDCNGKISPRLKDSTYINSVGGDRPKDGCNFFGYFTKNSSDGTQSETWWRIFQNVGKNIVRHTGAVSVETKMCNYVSIYASAKYTAQDAVLRIYDDSTSVGVNQSWFGCLKGKKFFNNNFTWGTNDSVSSDDDSSYGVNGGGWYGCNTQITRPTMYVTRRFVTGNEFVSSTASLPLGRYDIMLAGKTVSAASNVGYSNDDKFSVFCTLEYDGNQESQPVYCASNKWASWLWNSGSGFSSVSLMLAVNQKINKRLSAVKLYRRDYTKGKALNNGDLILLAKVDINGGITAQGGTENWTNKIWDIVTHENVFHRIAINLRKEDIENTVDTYYSETGMEQNENPYTLNIRRVRSALIANNRTFIGGLSYVDDSGNIINYNDRVVFSPVNRYDTFLPSKYYVDVGENDGDDITGMAFWKGMLLVFKNRRTYILDISSADVSEWKYVDKYDQAGATNQNYICTTPYGIAFSNENQVTLFDGNSFKEISLPIRNNWQTAWNIFGGIAFHKKLNLLLSIQNSSGGYYYSFLTNSWGKYYFSKTYEAKYQTSIMYDETLNDVIRLTEEDEGGVPIHLVAYFYSGLSTTSYAKSKWFSFEMPSVNKKWLNAYITYKGSVSLYWYKDGATSASISGTGANSSYSTATIAINKNARIACVRADAKAASTEIYEIGMSVRKMRGVK